MGQQEMAMTGKNRIMIYGPKTDGTYVVEFRTAAGAVLAISIPRSEAAVIQHFQERMLSTSPASRAIRSYSLPTTQRVNAGPARPSPCGKVRE